MSPSKRRSTPAEEQELPQAANLVTGTLTLPMYWGNLNKRGEWSASPLLRAANYLVEADDRGVMVTVIGRVVSCWFSTSQVDSIKDWSIEIHDPNVPSVNWNDDFEALKKRIVKAVNKPTTKLFFAGGPNNIRAYRAYADFAGEDGSSKPEQFPMVFDAFGLSLDDYKETTNMQLFKPGMLVACVLGVKVYDRNPPAEIGVKFDLIECHSLGKDQVIQTMGASSPIKRIKHSA